MTYSIEKLAWLSGNRTPATMRRFDYFDDVQLVHEFKNDPSREIYYGPMRRIVVRADHSSDEARFFADVTLWGKNKSSAITVELDVFDALERVDPANRSAIDMAAAKLDCKRYKQIGWSLYKWWSRYQEIAFQAHTWAPSMTVRKWADGRDAIHAQISHLSPAERKKQMIKVPHSMLTYGMRKAHENDLSNLQDKIRSKEIGLNARVWKVTIGDGKIS